MIAITLLNLLNKSTFTKTSSEQDVCEVSYSFWV